MLTAVQRLLTNRYFTNLQSRNRQVVGYGTVEKTSLMNRTSTMSSTSSNSPDTDGMNLQVHHDPDNQEFSITLGQDKAVLQYTVDAEGTADLWHTLVPPAFRGKGVAKILAQTALDHFSSTSTPMRLSCTYLQKFATDRPQPSHQKYIVHTN